MSIKLYEEPKHIVELLPHEFKKYDAILWRNWTTNRWTRGRFIEMAEDGTEYICDWPHVGILNSKHFHKYVVPYEGNERLEGTVTEGEHGAAHKTTNTRPYAKEPACLIPTAGKCAKLVRA